MRFALTQNVCLERASMIQKLTEPQKKYLQTWLDKVSRSFALVIPKVESPLSENLAVSYLMCRVLDNIEDCTNPFTWQQKRFQEFGKLVENPGHAEEIMSHWSHLDWTGLTADENRLMGVEGLTLWQIYAEIPVDARSIISRWVLEMSKGMKAVKLPNEPPVFITYNGITLPENLAGYNQYCYYVAGTVGHLATELVILEYDVVSDVAANLLLNSEACGRALQKTNIIKDFAKDIQRGFTYLPATWMQAVDYAPLVLEGASSEWRYAVLKDVLNELADSVAYVVSLPETAVGYRRACLLSMFPAYQTILLAAKKQEQLFTPEHHIKISRLTMGLCLKDAQMLASNNPAIRQYGTKIEKEVDKAFNLSTISMSTRR